MLQVGAQFLVSTRPDSKAPRRDVALAMALAYVELGRESMASTPPAIVRGCELLETALKVSPTPAPPPPRPLSLPRGEAAPPSFRFPSPFVSM